MSLPATKLFLRSKRELESIWGPSSQSTDTYAITKDTSFTATQLPENIEFSKDGKYIALIHRESGIVIQDSETSKELLQIEHQGIQAISFSPLGNYLLSWGKLEKNASEGNLIVWNAKTGELIARYQQKNFSKQMWPSIQWSFDEKLCARMTTNTVQIFNGENIVAGPIGKITADGLTQFSISPTGYNIAVFVPEKKSRPARVSIFQYPQTDTATASKSFYKAQEVNMKWSPNGESLIIQTSTDVDTSGKSYYGETGLYFIQSDGDYDCIIPLTKEGQVHDVQWDPTGRGFIVLAGPMPSVATLYDNRAGPSFEFGSAHRNSIYWSPHGRFVCIAGFGNLRGDMDFWDRNKLKKMGSANSNAATTASWSPDSRYFVTGTTFPRLRVDNGFKVFKYNGFGPVISETRDELYEISWRPALPNIYPNRPQSPTRQGEAAKSTEAIKPEPKPQAYRPPRATGNLAAMMRREESGARKLDREKYRAPVGGGTRIPGLAPEPVSKPKNKSKTARKKKAKEEAALAAIQKATEAAQPTPPAAPVVTELTPEEKQKKLKALNKKLKQIGEIKQKLQNGDTLNDDQVKKMNTESDILAEIESLQ